MRALLQEFAPPAGRPPAAAVDMQRSYDRYFATGLYASRYPAPNPHMLDLILGELAPLGGRILDFGCGNGRYALPLAQMPGVSVFGYDISAVALQELERRRAALPQAVPALETLCGSFEDLDRRLADEPGFDLVILLFGVLGHIEQRSQRLAVLRGLRRRLRPGGRLIATVPNRSRRFRAEQVAARKLIAEGTLEQGDIRYRRHAGSDAIELYYHLYSPAEFVAELTEAGFTVAPLRAESVLTERAVLASPLAAAADAALRRVTPVSLAYGFVAIAELAA
jgi:tRNA (uracil-5-)-methyltransferase TRM9